MQRIYRNHATALSQVLFRGSTLSAGSRHAQTRCHRSRAARTLETQDLTPKMIFHALVPTVPSLFAQFENGSQEAGTVCIQAFLFRLGRTAVLPGVCFIWSVSPKDREARPWRRNSGTGQRQRPDGKKSFTRIIQYGTTSRPTSSKGLRVKLREQARTLSGPVPSCKIAGPSCVPPADLTQSLRQSGTTDAS